jgi:hypothetical protein
LSARPDATHATAVGCMTALCAELTRNSRALREGTVWVTASMVAAVGLSSVNIITKKDT